MNSSLERKIADVNDSVTERLDDLERSLPSIPSKALAASRASARLVNDVVESVATSVTRRFQNVGDDAADAARTTSGQARAAGNRAADSVSDSVSQTAGTARSAGKKVASTVKDGVSRTAGQARSASEKAAGDVSSAAKQTAGQAEAGAEKTATSAKDEVEGALDDVKMATDPDDYADMTKAELYDIATQRDIDGRSSMTKAELVGALQKS